MKALNPFIITMMLTLSALAIEPEGMGTKNLHSAVATKVMDEQEHKVILQVSAADPATQQVVISQIKNILESLPKAKIEVVCHSQGLALVVASQSKVAADLAKLVERGVIFAACENTMERKEIRKEDLLPGIITVPSAMAELVLKQKAGWIYLKAGI